MSSIFYAVILRTEIVAFAVNGTACFSEHRAADCSLSSMLEHPIAKQQRVIVRVAGVATVSRDRFNRVLQAPQQGVATISEGVNLVATLSGLMQDNRKNIGKHFFMICYGILYSINANKTVTVVLVQATQCCGGGGRWKFTPHLQTLHPHLHLHCPPQ